MGSSMVWYGMVRFGMVWYGMVLGQDAKGRNKWFWAGYHLEEGQVARARGTIESPGRSPHVFLHQDWGALGSLGSPGSLGRP